MQAAIDRSHCGKEHRQHQEKRQNTFSCRAVHLFFGGHKQVPLEGPEMRISVNKGFLNSVEKSTTGIIRSLSGRVPIRRQPVLRAPKEPIASAQMAFSPRSPVRMRIASSTGRTKIFPSPIFPVWAAFKIAETD